MIKKGRIETEEKTVKIEVELPVAVVRFLEDANALAGKRFDIKEYVQETVLECLGADLKAVEDSPFWDTEAIKKRYGLDKLLEDC